MISKCTIIISKCSLIISEGKVKIYCNVGGKLKVGGGEGARLVGNLDKQKKGGEGM